jgi:EipB-like
MFKTSGIAFGLLALASVEAVAAPLASHRAFYEFTLGRNEHNSGYSAAQGRLAYEIIGSTCEGWSVNYRFASRYIQAEGSVQLTDSQLTSWEAGDGHEFRLNQKYFVDNALSKEGKIIAIRKNGAAPEGEITLPTQSTFKLPAEAMFPVIYQSKLLAEAAKGASRDSTVVYEGTDGDKAFRVISVIGKKKITPVTASAASAAPPEMKDMASWPITTSYYDANQQDVDQPLYQSHYTMYENGVSTGLLFDYGTYTLKGELTKLELIKTEPCGG